MFEAWRIVKQKHAATAFSGEGAARAGGRWNSRGTLVVYTSATRALAALETLVHLNPPVLFRYVVIRTQFDDSLVERISPSSLPLDWRAEPPASSTKMMGDRWVREKRSAVLQIPSAIIPGEDNFLLNPAHPEFDQIQTGIQEPFAFDTRLLN
jgi:RES domain-containing protein